MPSRKSGRRNSKADDQEARLALNEQTACLGGRWKDAADGVSSSSMKIDIVHDIRMTRSAIRLRRTMQRAPKPSFDLHPYSRRDTSNGD